MSKNLKCPVCQKGTIMFKENLSCECSQCRFQCHHGHERIAAAMSEIQPCPICGKHPMFPPTYDPCEPSPEAVECCGFVAYTAELWNQYAAAMEHKRKWDTDSSLETWFPYTAEELARSRDVLARHNALVDAVAWERECGTVSFTGLWFDEWNRTEDQSKSAMQELRFTRRAARAEVDRLINKEKMNG